MRLNKNELDKALEGLDMTYADLAYKTGLPESTIDRALTKGVSAEVASYISRFLGVKLATLAREEI